MALAEVFEAFAGPDAPVEFAAYDGSHAGPVGSPVKITVRSPVAVAYLAQAPGALGLARAYVAGHLDVEGDMYDVLTRMTKAQSISLGPAEKLRLLQALGGPKLLLHRMPVPPQEVRVNRRWLGGGTPRAATPTRSRTTTTSPTGSTSGCSGPRWRIPAPAIRARTQPWKRRRPTSSTWLRASWGCVRACGCWTWAAAGAAW